MESVDFVMGDGPGQKPAVGKINDTVLKDVKVNSIIVNDVTNNTTFNHSATTGDLEAGNEVGFPLDAVVTVFYTPLKTCKC